VLAGAVGAVGVAAVGEGAGGDVLAVGALALASVGSAKAAGEMTPSEANDASVASAVRRREEWVDDRMRGLGVKNVMLEDAGRRGPGAGQARAIVIRYGQKR
jgi:hypothetical protein